VTNKDIYSIENDWKNKDIISNAHITILLMEMRINPIRRLEKEKIIPPIQPNHPIKLITIDFLVINRLTSDITY